MVSIDYSSKTIKFATLKFWYNKELYIIEIQFGENKDYVKYISKMTKGVDENHQQNYWCDTGTPMYVAFVIAAYKFMNIDDEYQRGRNIFCRDKSIAATLQTILKENGYEGG